MNPAGQAGWPAGQPRFGNVIPASPPLPAAGQQDVKVVIVHGTEGWPARNKATQFVHRYTIQFEGESQVGEVHPCAACHGAPAGAAAGCSCKWGIGPMYYVSNDGTIARLMSSQEDEALLTWHAEFMNDRSIGVETGNLFNDVPAPGHGWVRVSQTPAVEDVPGANLYLFDHHDVPQEVVACWFTTAHYAGPAREQVGAGWMLYSEAQYRAWAILARFLAEQFNVPRNLPLLPWEDPSSPSAADNYRRIVLGDPDFDAIVSALPANWHMTSAAFEQNQPGFPAAYNALGAGAANLAFLQLFNTYRGFCGHKFAGGHECPGPVFDWHRFAREVWDWWWYPFDLVAAPPLANPTTAAPRRGYSQPDRSTPLLEHYFDDDNQTDILVPLDNRHAARVRDGVLGNTSSPATWQLDPTSPVYAMANGELVAARFAHPAGAVSMSFVLVRHLIFHRTVGGADPVSSLRLDYDRAASTVYSLYVHIGHPAGLDLAAVNAVNPDWLNRVHVRKKECDLGGTFFSHPTHHGIPDAAWHQPLPGQLARPTLDAGWQTDQVALTTFLNDLSAGNVAMAPFAAQTTPIRILLGDYLGNGGVVSNAGGAQVQGIRVEVFSPAVLPGFTLTGAGASWDALPPGFAGIPVQQYPSEWARALTDAEKASLTALGVDVNLATWWPGVARAMTADPRIVAADRLPENGQVFHYQPFDFLRWINTITWKSEWPKYEVRDAAGQAQPSPAIPRSRRW